MNKHIHIIALVVILLINTQIGQSVTTNETSEQFSLSRGPRGFTFANNNFWIISPNYHGLNKLYEFTSDGKLLKNITMAINGSAHGLTTDGISLIVTVLPENSSITNIVFLDYTGIITKILNITLRIFDEMTYGGGKLWTIGRWGGIYPIFLEDVPWAGDIIVNAEDIHNQNIRSFGWKGENMLIHYSKVVIEYNTEDKKKVNSYDLPSNYIHYITYDGNNIWLLEHVGIPNQPNPKYIITKYDEDLYSTEKSVGLINMVPVLSLILTIFVLKTCRKKSLITKYSVC